MFLKNVKQFIFHSNSILKKLTLFYTLAACLLLTVIGLFLNWGTINLLDNSNYRFLIDEIDTIQYIFDNQSADWHALQQEAIVIPQTTHASMYHYYIRVLDNQKQVIETPGMQNILTAQHFITSQPDNKRNFRWYKTHQTTYLLAQAPIKLANQHQGIVQIALDVGYQHRMIHDRSKLIISLILGTLCAALIGFFIAKRGMRSLYELTNTAKKISATSLDQRIDPKSWPDELSALGVAFNQMLERIEISFKRLKQFSADLAHELRTPVNNLIGESEIALSNKLSPADCQSLMESHLEELQRIAKVIENILFLTRAENPQLTIEKSPLAAAKEINHICEYYRSIADEKNITLLCLGDALINANQVMFRRMLSNVLSNAIKYSHENSQIQFIIEEIDHSFVKITVQDCGIGIEAMHLPKLTDRFYRVDAARSQAQGGMGLGLAIVKSILEVHQGKLEIVSQLGIGTAVLMTLPK